MDCADLTAANAETFGGTITYSPHDGEASEITAIIKRDEYREEDAEDGTVIIKRATVTVQSIVVGEPDRRDRTTFDGEEWSVCDIERTCDGDAWMLGVKRAISIERSRPGYRRRRQ